MLYIKRTEEKGRGVYSDCDLKEGEIVEESEVVLIPPDQAARLEGTILEFYMCSWDDTLTECLAFGNAMVYNHSTEPNIIRIEDHERMLMVFKAIKPIPAHEELCYDYTGGSGRVLEFGDGKYWYADGLPWWHA